MPCTLAVVVKEIDAAGGFGSLVTGPSRSPLPHSAPSPPTIPGMRGRSLRSARGPVPGQASLGFSGAPELPPRTSRGSAPHLGRPPRAHMPPSAVPLRRRRRRTGRVSVIAPAGLARCARPFTLVRYGLTPALSALSVASPSLLSRRHSFARSVCLARRSRLPRLVAPSTDAKPAYVLDGRSARVAARDWFGHRTSPASRAPEGRA